MILDASGYYTILHVGRDRPKVTANPLRDASAEEYKRIAMGVQANCGTWSVDEAGKTLTWHIQGGLFPNVDTASNQAQQVSDVNGHVSAVYRLAGMAFFPDGGIGTSSVIGASDTVPSAGTTHNGYYTRW
jgi:hypothetical protein